MINKKLLNQELKLYNKNNIFLKPITYNKSIIKNLFDKYKDYGMEQNQYCCYGEQFCCWAEVIEEGVNDYSLKDVKEDTLSNIKCFKKYLYNTKKYGQRIYVYENNNSCYIYVYCRDLLKVDYYIWFSN